MRREIHSLMPKRLIEWIRLFRKQAINFKILSSDYGQWRTIKSYDALNVDGDPIPWYTYPALEYLGHLDLSRFRVFEYGSGNSTLWWAKRVRHITSVEDSEIWHKKISEKIAISFKNTAYILEKDQMKYVSLATDSFDIFVVDGKFRRACIDHVLGLRTGLLLILDNADWYPQSVEYIKRKLGWMQVDFHGFGPINNYTWTSTIFINPSRYSELIYKQPLASTGCVSEQVNDDC